MDEQTTPKFYSDRLAWGLTLLAVALLADLIGAAYGFANLGTEFDPDSIEAAANAMNPFLIALSCLGPLGLLLKIVAIFLIVSDSRRLNAMTGGLHQRLGWVAVVLFVISLLAQGGAIVLSFSGTTGGSEAALETASWISLVSSLLGTATVVLLVFGIAGPAARIALLAGLVVFMVSTIGATVLTVQNTTLQSYEIMEQTFYAPMVNLDRTQGIYPVLSGAGTLALALLFGAMLVMAIRAWRSISQELPESVA